MTKGKEPPLLAAEYGQRLDNKDAISKEPEAYPLDFPGLGDNASPEYGIYIATVSDGRQTFATYIIKDRLKEQREILAIPPFFAGDTEKAESYAIQEISGGRSLNVFRYSLRDTYKNQKQVALLDKAMRMLEKAGLCESCEK